MPNYRMEKGSIQHQFNMSRAKMQIMGGAFGNGKTTALVIKALGLVKDYPGSNGLLARATYPKLNDTLKKVFMEWCPVSWIKKRPTQEDNTCYMVNGTAVNFRYVAQRGKGSASGETSSNLLSATFDWIGVDQVEDPEITHKDLLDLMGRLRGQTPYRPDGAEDPSMPSTGPRWMMLTANPAQNWFYKEIIQPYLAWKKYGTTSEKLLVDGDTGLPLMELYEGSTYTNAANLPADYIKGLESTYKGQMRKRFLMGEWAAYEGLVHADYSRDVHCLTRDQIEAHLARCVKRHVQIKVIEGYDFGLQSPSCYLLGFVDDVGRVFILDGFYRPNFHYTDQPSEIFSIRLRYASMLRYNERINADPAIFKRTVVAGKKDTGETISKLLADQEIYTRPASNHILPGIAKVNAYLANTLWVPHPITGEKSVDGHPLLYIADDLDWFDDEISNYYWKKNPLGQNIDEPQDNNDHAMNALKYFLAFSPHPSKIIVPQAALPPGWMRWQEFDTDKKGQIVRV